MRLTIVANLVFILVSFAATRGDSTRAVVDPSLRDFVVKYLSAESVYLDGGRLDGLRKGDRLMITRGDSVVAVLEIRYVSNTSASCAVVESAGRVFPNDVAILSQRGPEVAGQSFIAPGDSAGAVPEPAADSQTVARQQRPPARYNGAVSIQFYSWADRDERRIDFSQSTLRINFRARQIGGYPLSLSVRTRGEYDLRNRSYAAAVPKDDWENRIHELSLSFDSPSSPLNFQIGRILPRKLSGAGYIDGFSLRRNVSSKTSLGVFAGLRPRWQYQDNAVSLQKYGLFFSLSRGENRSSSIEQSISLTGEYHGSTPSREYLYLQGSMNLRQRWTTTHIFELDLNRGWRKDREGSGFTLTSVYLNSRYRFNRVVSAGVTFDNRRSVWSYESLTTADSLFDSQLRTGWRGQINLRLPLGVSLYTNVGYRKRSGDASPTTSYSGSFTKSGLVAAGSSLSLRYAAFDGPNSRGSNYGARISQTLWGSSSVDIGFAEYRYRLNGGDARTNRTIDGVTYLNLSRHFFWIGSLQFDRGDDVRGVGIRLESGYRI